MRGSVAVLVMLAACVAPGAEGYKPRESVVGGDSGGDSGRPDSDTDSGSDSDTGADSSTHSGDDSSPDTDSQNGGDDSAPPVDADGDGYDVSADCDDGDSSVNPGAAEVCLTGRDEDCDGGGSGCVGTTWSVTTDTWAYEGSEAGSLSGRAIASGVDLTGDGVVDVVVGAPGVDSAAVDAGSVGVAPGPLDGSGVGVGDVEVLTGEEKGDGAGTAVAAADLNLDGYGDLVVGAERGASGSDAGRAYVVYGPVADSSSLSKADLCLDLESSGYSLAEVEAGEDWDGDGLPDLLLSSPEAGEGGGGAVFAVDLVDAARIVASTGGCYTVKPVESSTRGATVASFSGAEADDDATRVLQRDDLDGDGVAELLIGAPGHDTTAGADAGTFYSTNDCAGSDCGLGGSGSVDVKLRGTSVYEQLGADIATGDLDGDGYADLAVSSLGDAVGGLYAGGGVYVIAGSASFDETSSLSDAVGAMASSVEGFELGRSLCGGMDANGDGLADLLVGAAGTDDAGAAFVFFGPLAGMIEVDDAAATLVHGAAYAGLSHTRYGSACGDPTGDGLSDVVVGADFSGDTSTPGAVFVLPGAFY